MFSQEKRDASPCWLIRRLQHQHANKPAKAPTYPVTNAIQICVQKQATANASIGAGTIKIVHIMSEKSNNNCKNLRIGYIKCQLLKMTATQHAERKLGFG